MFILGYNFIWNGLSITDIYVFIKTVDSSFFHHLHTLSSDDFADIYLQQKSGSNSHQINSNVSNYETTAT